MLSFVPAAAILNQADGGPAVMIAGADNRAHLQAVQVGVVNAGNVQITSGVKAGQQVIVNGGYGLPDNTPIKIETIPTPEKPETGKSTSD